jgi:SAM-dependent methyltransferase
MTTELNTPEAKPYSFSETSYGFIKRIEFVSGAVRSAFDGKPPEQIRILDVGCGTGNMMAAPLAREGYQVDGIDLHEPTIEYARQQYSDLPNLQFRCQLLEECRGAQYDVVVASEVLEHITGYESFFHDLIDALSPTGLLIFTVPNGHGPFEWQNFLWRNVGQIGIVQRLREARRARRRDFGSYSFLNADSIHVNFFTRRRLESLILNSGLTLERYEGRTFLCGLFVSPVVEALGLTRLNSRLGSQLPSSIVSGWMFSARRAA